MKLHAWDCQKPSCRTRNSPAFTRCRACGSDIRYGRMIWDRTPPATPPAKPAAAMKAGKPLVRCVNALCVGLFWIFAFAFAILCPWVWIIVAILALVRLVVWQLRAMQVLPPRS